jgi:hypothetical protein
MHGTERSAKRLLDQWTEAADEPGLSPLHIADAMLFLELIRHPKSRFTSFSALPEELAGRMPSTETVFLAQSANLGDPDAHDGRCVPLLASSRGHTTINDAMVRALFDGSEGGDKPWTAVLRQAQWALLLVTGDTYPTTDLTSWCIHIDADTGEVECT